MRLQNVEFSKYILLSIFNMNIFLLLELGAGDSRLVFIWWMANKVNIVSTFSAREDLVISLNLLCVMIISQALHDIIITKH